MKVTFFNHSKISNILVTADEACERLPLISTVNSIKNIFVKYAIVPLLLLVNLVDKKSIWQNYYVSHILNKDLNRNLWLLVPGFGNFKIYQQDSQRPAKDKDDSLFDQTVKSVPQSEKLEIATLLAEKDPETVLDGLAKFEVSTVQSDEDKKAKMKLATVLKEKEPAKFLDKVNEFNFGEMEKIEIAKSLPAKNAQALSETFAKLHIDSPEIQWDLLYINLNAAKARYNLAATGEQAGLEEKADLDSFLPVALALIPQLTALEKGGQIKQLKVIDPEFYYQVLAAYVNNNEVPLRELRLDKADLIALAPYLTYVNLIDAPTHGPYTMTEEFISQLLTAAVNATQLILKNSNVTGACLEHIPNKGQFTKLEIQDCPEFNSPFPADMDGLEELSITRCGSYDQPLPAKLDKLQILRINHNAKDTTEDCLSFFVEVYQNDRARGIRLADSFYESLQGPTDGPRSLKNILRHMFTQKNPEQAQRISAWFTNPYEDAMLPALENADTPFVHDERLAADPLQQLYIYSIYSKVSKDQQTTAKKLLEFLIKTPMKNKLEKLYLSFYSRGHLWYRCFLSALNNSTFFTTLSPDAKRQFFPYLARLDSGWSTTLRNLGVICELGKIDEFKTRYAPALKKANILAKENLFTGDREDDLLTLDILYAYHAAKSEAPPTALLGALQKLLKSIPANLRRDVLPFLVVADSDSDWDTMLKNLKGLIVSDQITDFESIMNRNYLPETSTVTREGLLQLANRCLQTPGLFYEQIDEDAASDDKFVIDGKTFDSTSDVRFVIYVLRDNLEKPFIVNALLANLSEIRKITWDGSERNARSIILPYLNFDTFGKDNIIQNLSKLTEFDYLEEFVSKFPPDAAGARLLSKANIFNGDQPHDLPAEVVFSFAKMIDLDWESYEVNTLIDLVQGVTLHTLPSYLPYLFQRTRGWDAMVQNLRNLDVCGQLNTFGVKFDNIERACKILETSGLFTENAADNKATLRILSEPVDRAEIERDPKGFFGTPCGRVYTILHHHEVFANAEYINILIELYPPTNPENHSLYPVEVRRVNDWRHNPGIHLHIIPQMISAAPDIFIEKLRGCAQLHQLYISSPEYGMEAGGPARQFISQLFVGIIYNSKNLSFVKGDDLAKPRADNLFVCTQERKEHYRELGNLMGFTRRLDEPKGYPIGEIFNQKWLDLIRSFTTEQLEDKEFTAEKFFDVKSMNPQQLIDFLRKNSPIYSSPQLQEQLQNIERILGQGVPLDVAEAAARKLNTTVEEEAYYGYEDTDLDKILEIKNNNKAKLEAIHNRLRSLLLAEHKGYVEVSHAVAQGMKEALPFYIGKREMETWSDIGKVSTKEFALSLQGAVDAETIKANIDYFGDHAKGILLKLWVDRWLDDNKNDRLVLGNFVQLFSGARAIYEKLKFSFDPSLPDVQIYSCFKTATFPTGITEDGLRAKLDAECKEKRFGDVKYGHRA